MTCLELELDKCTQPLKEDSLQFVASMTISPSDIEKIRLHLKYAQASVDPLQNVLITPLFASVRSLRLIEEMARNEGKRVYFDSGGYYVQIGRLKYEELYLPLLDAYKANRWATVYTLPDHVPTSLDHPDLVERKVRDTISYGKLFFQEMPDDLKPKAMPVVQGHTQAQIDMCLEAYIKLGVKQIGFGSFGTAGKNSEMNIATNGAVGLAEYVANVAKSYGIKTHLFGIGRPALVAMVKGINAASFDSSSWLKAAGFGQVFLPFMRGYNITYDAHKSKLELGITFNQFQEWVTLTGHQCELCNSLAPLQNKKMHRAVHNLICVAEAVEMVNSGNYECIRSIYENGSPKYRNEYTKWLQPN